MAGSAEEGGGSAEVKEAANNDNAANEDNGDGGECASAALTLMVSCCIWLAVCVCTGGRVSMLGLFVFSPLERGVNRAGLTELPLSRPSSLPSLCSLRAEPVPVDGPLSLGCTWPGSGGLFAFTNGELAVCMFVYFIVLLFVLCVHLLFLLCAVGDDSEYTVTVWNWHSGLALASQSADKHPHKVRLRFIFLSFLSLFFSHLRCFLFC